MSLRDGAAKMPSSKVIKADQALQAISNFSFRQVNRNDQADTAADEGAACFVPLEIFDPTELGSRAGFLPPKQSAEPLPEIPGTFISDTEREKELQDSYQRGLQDGKNLAERGLLNVFKSMRTASEDLQQLREKVLRDSEDDLLALVIAVAKRVVHQEVAQDRQVVLRVIRAALQNLSENDDLVIRVHPDDQALLTTSQNQALQRELAGFTFSLRPDTSLQPGCCQVETALGTVDASFDAQIEEIYRRMQEERTGVNFAEVTPIIQVGE